MYVSLSYIVSFFWFVGFEPGYQFNLLVYFSIVLGIQQENVRNMGKFVE